ncbi:PilZ domain-containing protein [Thioflexithrix psekupsensis]|uniref:PilZ domain-containing protein n=1 Tax=Thioflexithrix psekupsensis TaxID=1570016 RepID=UPI0015931608|nr:PilZ domain-containing protein [Thioflexithrix psekupsensis]
MKKFEPENWQKRLSDLHDWLGSDEAIIRALQQHVDLPSHHITLLPLLREGRGQIRDVYDAVGRAIRHLHLLESEKERHGELDKRRFIRHPVTIPLKVSHTSSSELFSVKQSQQALNNISLGGLAFHSQQAFELGIPLKINIDLVNPPFEALCSVAWCQPKNGGYDIGVRFIDQDDAEEARMVEQICHIEDYRKKLERQGRYLDMEAAAVEWLTEYGENFPLEEDAIHS